ncbi:MAG: hypothetical protein LBE91_12395, partial [Tannerella sp.]|nr:hypothetical protein [Tannerella sp.]
MIIFYGTREARLSTKVFEDRFCPYCGQKGTVTCTVFSKHAHVFWIPLLPVGKREVIWCTHCGHEFKHAGETGPDLQKRIAAFSYRQKVPFWQWTGLLLLIAFIANTLIFGYLGARRETKNTELFIESPQVGDVYCVKYEKVYTLMAIDSIENDSVFFIENKYTMSFKSEAIQLHRDAFYDHDYIYGYTHDELKEMFHEDKSILNIWRNLPYQTKKLDLTDEERKLLEEDGDNEEEDEYDAFMEKMYEDNEV